MVDSLFWLSKPRWSNVWDVGWQHEILHMIWKKWFGEEMDFGYLERCLRRSVGSLSLAFFRFYPRCIFWSLALSDTHTSPRRV